MTNERQRHAALDALNEALLAAARHLNRLGFENSASVELGGGAKLWFVPGVPHMTGGGLIVELPTGERHAIVGAKVLHRKMAAEALEELFSALLVENQDDYETIMCTIVAFRFAEGAFDELPNLHESLETRADRLVKKKD